MVDTEDINSIVVNQYKPLKIPPSSNNHFLILCFYWNVILPHSCFHSDILCCIFSNTREWGNHWKSCFFCNSMWHFICSTWEVFQVSAEREKFHLNICQMISLHLLKLEGVCFTDVNILLISTNKDLQHTLRNAVPIKNITITDSIEI